MSFVVVIPVHNECTKIAGVLKELQEHCENCEKIIIVDDGSRDGTASIAEQCKEKFKDIKILKHKINLGKGAALKTGCDYALQKGAARIIVMDGDGQHEPKEIPRFLEALNNADIVFSCRKRPKTMPFVLKFGNSFINAALELLFGFKINDSQCGYRAFTAESYKKVRWTATDYYMETEMILRAAKHKLRYAQIPVETIYVDKYKGTTVLDGMMIVAKMVTWRLLR